MLNKIIRYTTNIQKLAAFLYTNNEQLKCEIKKTIPFMIPPKKILRHKLTKRVESAYRKLENIHKVIKEGLYHWRGILFSLRKGLNIKIPIIPYLIYKFNAISSKTPGSFL